MPESISLKRVYEELRKIEKKMITKKQIESLIHTIEVMGNPDTMKQIAGSMNDIKHKRVKEVSSVKDLLSEV